MLKLMLELVMDVDNIVLRSLPQCIQILQLNNIPGENTETATSYLKGTFILLQTCNEILTDTMKVLNTSMCSTKCDKFSGIARSVYYKH